MDLDSCSICRSQPPINAIQLRCGHKFCYLCAKGSVQTTGKCGYCRTEIGPEFHFQEHEILGDVIKVPTPFSDTATGFSYYWFYEGFRGWWMYDADTNRLIEEAKVNKIAQIEKLIAGDVYVIDLINLTQQRKDGEGRIRKICRAKLDDLENIIGMAGIKGQDFDEILNMMKTAPIIKPPRQ